MKYVLDACVALKTLLVNEADADLALIFMDDARAQVHQIIAPDTLPIEMCHVLTKAERQGEIQKGEGQQLFAKFLKDCPTLYPYGDLLDRAMQLSSDFRLGVFDCLYLALAEEESCPVVTVDKRFLQLFPRQTISLKDL